MSAAQDPEQEEGRANNNAECPTPTGHRRLEEVHRWWHGCMDNYDNPDGFRANLNACIQSLRNVTWVIQKEKSRIPGFRDWYAGWQEKMKNDEVMLWIVKSRNRIVKEGDLELKSTAKGRLIATYYDSSNDPNRNQPSADNQEASIDQKIFLPPRAAIRQYIARVNEMGIPPSILDDAVLSIERRWVDSALPEWELLTALAHSYSFLSNLVNDAHDLLGISHEVMADTIHGPISLAPRAHDKGMLPCMIAIEDHRTTVYRIRDGSLTVGGLTFPMGNPSAELDARVIRKYKLNQLPKVEASSLTDLVPFFAEIAKSIIKRDKSHGWFIFYFKGLVLCGQEIVYARDRSDKLLLAKRVADTIRVNEFDGVIVTGEMWMAPTQKRPDGSFIPPAESPDRIEAVMVYAEDSKRNMREWLITFSRRFGRIILGDEIDSSGSEDRYNFLIPTREIWRKWQPDAPAD